MTDSILNNLKLLFTILFLFVGLYFSYQTYDLLNYNAPGSFSGLRSKPVGSGVDTANDGVATGFGFISGFSLFSSAFLLSSVKGKK